MREKEAKRTDAPTREKSNEFRLELLREVLDMFPGMLPDHEHLPQMRLGLGMALETVLISTLLLADLAVPPQALKPLGLHLVRDILRSPNYVLFSKELVVDGLNYLQREAS
jgi:hypothetical protein